MAINQKLIKLRVNYIRSDDPNNIFLVDTHQDDKCYVPLEVVNIMRNDIADKTLMWNDPKLQLILTLFHRDKSFDGMFIKHISFEEETDELEEHYAIRLYQVVPKKHYGYFKIVTQKSENWKCFKKLICAVIEECPICYQTNNKQVGCPTCSKLICYECVINGIMSMGHIRCPYCAYDMDKKTTEVNRMKIKYFMTNSNNSAENRRKLAENLFGRLFSMRPS